MFLHLFHKRRGFTLVELIIVIVVLGLLAGLAVPKFISVQRDAQVSAMYQDIDALNKVITTYFTQTDEYPIGEKVTLPSDSDLLRVVQSTGDTGNELYKVDINKTSKYHSRLRYGHGEEDDYYIYSTETVQKPGKFFT